MPNLHSNTHGDVSVVLPFHKIDEFLNEAVQSVLRDQFTLLEIILVADRLSKSELGQVFAAYENQPLIKVVESPGAGIVDALNAGIGLAKGDYIARMDGDDISRPGRFRAQRDFLATNPRFAAVGSSIELICPHGETIGTRRFPRVIRTVLGRSPFQPRLAHPASMIRKSALKELGGYRDLYPHAEDQDLWSRILDKWFIANLSETFLSYRVHPQQVSQLKRGDQATSTLRISVDTALRRKHLDAALAVFHGKLATQEGQASLLDGLPKQISKSIQKQMGVYRLALELSQAKSDMGNLTQQAVRALLSQPATFLKVVGSHGWNALMSLNQPRLKCSVCQIHQTV